MPELRELKIDIDLLKSSFEDASGRADFYLDTETGDIEMDTEDDKFERIGDDGEFPYEDERYLQIPHADSREDYRTLEAFIDTIRDSRIQSTLEIAIQGSGAFSRFRSVLYRYPEEQKRWFDFKDKRLNQRVMAWLKSHGVKPLGIVEEIEGDTDFDLFEITSSEITPPLIALLDRTRPSAFRAMAVLEGECRGRIWTDDATHPTWLIVQEGVFGTVFWSESVTGELLQRVVTQIRQTSDTDVRAIVLPEDSSTQAMLSSHPLSEQRFIEFTNRPLHQGLEAFLQIPEGLHLRRVDRKLLTQSIDYDFYVDMMGGVEALLEKALGLFLMRGDEILCEAFAGTSGMGMIEIGINTRENARQKGYALLTSAHLIQACEALGYDTCWHTTPDNTASIHLARKLGYRSKRDYVIWSWSKRA